MDTRFQKGESPNKCIYPMTRWSIKNLKDCRLVNPMVGKHHGVKVPDDHDIEAAMEEVKQVRELVKTGEFPFEFMDKYYPFEGEFPREIPECLAMMGLSFDDPEALANIVHMDSPNAAPLAYHRWLTHPDFNQNVNVRDWTPNHINFLETIPRAERNIAAKVWKRLYQIFQIKNFWGNMGARPEEIWNQQGLDGVSMTAYEEGCPNHPNSPQGHAGAVFGGIEAVFEDFPDRSPAQTKAGLDTGYMWAQFRGLAAVHDGKDAQMSLAANPVMNKYMIQSIRDKYLLTRSEKVKLWFKTSWKNIKDFYTYVLS